MKSTGPMFILTALFGLHLLATSHQAGAQEGGLDVTEVTGKLEAIVGLQIKLKSEEGTDYMAVVDPQDTTFKYVGTADIKFLTKGMMLRFTAPFSQAGAASDPIQELEIFSPVRQRRMRAEQLQEITAGIYPVVKKENDSTPAPPAGFENYRIVGQLAGVQGEKMQVATGARALIVPFSPDMVINVSSGDTTFCMEGDEIRVSGLSNAAQPNWIKASTITVTGAKPLAPPEKAVRSPRGKREEKPATPAPKK